jgi:hypothetical protein
MAAAANATTTRIQAHLGRRELMLMLMESLHESALSVRLLPQNHHRIRRRLVAALQARLRRDIEPRSRRQIKAEHLGRPEVDLRLVMFERVIRLARWCCEESFISSHNETPCLIQQRPIPRSQGEKIVDAKAQDMALQIKVVRDGIACG